MHNLMVVEAGSTVVVASARQPIYFKVEFLNTNSNFRLFTGTHFLLFVLICFRDELASIMELKM
jgi:hypothetical protein